ncbi:MAG: cell division protein ZapA [Oscillospiraceae bacterium]|nr:cell division protein ZapA [Oscillospiraceae bacterium]
MNAKVKLNICGSEYYITSEDEEIYIRSIGDEVDKRMTEMLEGNARVSTTMAAVLCALSYADDCHKANDAADNLRAQIKEYLEDSQRSRLEADEAKREVERLRRELQGLRLRLAEMDDR